MEKFAVEIKNLAKTYYLYDRPVDRLKAILVGDQSKAKRIDALLPLSLQIRQGSTFGIVGKNGSGKSTLLSLIAGVLTATEGQVTVHGRITALLELGSGFNPEFTGLDNVFLYGSILGCSNNEVKEKLSDILAFADIGDFIKQPVKTYSSGMILRLAFAVATSVEPDVVIIDEALSVGDARFQHKCINRIRTMIAQGVTVIFVSHDFNVIKTLCDRAILLEHGELITEGKPDEVLKTYQSRMFAAEQGKDQVQQHSEEEPRQQTPQGKSRDRSESQEQFATKIGKDRFGTGQAQITGVRILDPRGSEVEIADYGDELKIEITADFFADVDEVTAGLTIKSSKGLDAVTMSTENVAMQISEVKAGQSIVYSFSFVNRLQADHYSLTVAIMERHSRDKMKPFDWVENACLLKTCEIPGSKFYGIYLPEITAADWSVQ